MMKVISSNPGTSPEQHFSSGAPSGDQPHKSHQAMVANQLRTSAINKISGSTISQTNFHRNHGEDNSKSPRQQPAYIGAQTGTSALS